MSTELAALVSDLGIKPAQAAKTELVKVGDYLSPILVYGGNSEVVKEGKFPLGHLGMYVNKDNIIDLGTQFDCINFGARTKAAIVQSGENPLSYYNEESSGFKDIVAKANSGMQGYLFGYEYLVWIPSIAKFGLFHMGNKTLRNESEKMYSLIGKAATIKIKFIRTQKYSWHGAEILNCDTPPLPLPEKDQVVKELEKFNNPKDSEVEVAQTDNRAR